MQRIRGFAIAALSAAATHAQTYPRDLVTLVTHSSPGGGSDVFLRELIKHLTPIMGTTFAVDVRGRPAAAQVVKTPFHVRS